MRRYGSHDKDEPTIIDSIDTLVDRFASDGATDPYQTHPNQIPTITPSMPTAQNALSTNEIDRNETICRNNGFSVGTNT